jgi:hypothetical protein
MVEPAVGSQELAELRKYSRASAAVGLDGIAAIGLKGIVTVRLDIARVTTEAR